MDECYTSPERKRPRLHRSPTTADDRDCTVMASSAPEEAESPCFFGDDVDAIFSLPPHMTTGGRPRSLFASTASEADDATQLAPIGAIVAAPSSQGHDSYDRSLPLSDDTLEGLMLAQASEDAYSGGNPIVLSPASQMCVLSHIGALAARPPTPPPQVAVEVLPPRRSTQGYGKKILAAAVEWDNCSEDAFLEEASDRDDWALDDLSDSDFE
ncbi:hypothetical protein SPRG_13612 [Saprolegnia parasitica CBS 223.65]|uniref:Uncharacterized protein n=1 Tax=Saprolegnia parasitica (strain CBS 223.65) TaxID=695850 RepID=A0A067C2M7_SAPPC|nr:hypothetical protein SPRG_13612 [Saprolegnia parasitica CBS 223.65]KDO20796.1 hypothetical protein SPRG_13612 [Saprolegnia parasitica CBS 223.65]|eukprot:XP_012208455.1 hypothetical protein SPRG_13612 [Saprolegnia parasitica CBS 223.65]